MYNWRVLPAILVSVVVLSVGTLAARDHSEFLRTPTSHFVESMTENSSVDWTGGFVFAGARVRLPRIIYDARHPDYRGPGTAASISEARAVAQIRAHELATLRLTQSVTDLRLDTRFTLLEKMRESRELRESLGELSTRFIRKSVHTGEGYVLVELVMPFHGEAGLYSMLVRPIYGSEEPPAVSPVDVVDPVSGVVIDLREFPEFRPSLEPRIYSDRGRLIYGPEVAGRTCLSRGLVAYHSSADLARQDRRVGTQPYYTYAAGVLGPGKSDIYLDAPDVERLLGPESGRRALTRCSVAFVVSKKK